jgi:hypothetical protein
VHTKVGSWIANINHMQLFNHHVLGGIIILFKAYNYKNEVQNITIEYGGNYVV